MLVETFCIRNNLYIQFLIDGVCVILNLRQWSVLSQTYDNIEYYYYFGDGTKLFDLTGGIFLRVSNSRIFLCASGCSIKLSIDILDYLFYKRINTELEALDTMLLFHF